ncbi:FAD-dependent oxidoreductase [Streptomyces sp. NPDC051219]|uniref:FAD-dependent oxidoreductase n=1 Tax=Streptomyces sp. NPDC051219 TaxID=3155283 RepID=UPI00343E9F1C
MATTPPTGHPSLEADLTVDTAVVGGGIAGLCTAWEVARAGREVVVLEAGHIASGVTGHTTGKLTALHGLGYARLRKAQGAEATALHARAQQEALDHVAVLCSELGIDAELERLPAFTYVRDERRTDEIRAEAEAAREAGLSASFVTETDLPYPVAAAVRVDGQLQFHPRKFLLGLADAFTALGGRIFEQTRITALHDGARCRLTTERGATVHAKDVVVATHFPAFDHTSLIARLTPRRELVIAAPVPADMAPQGMYITPEEGTRSVRTAPYGSQRRLLIVTGESFVPGSGDVVERLGRLDSWACEHLPGFADADTRYHWSAQDNDSTDHLPYVGHVHPGTQHVFVATGFGGWGMSNGVMAGRLLAAHLTGGPRPAWTELYDPRRLVPLKEMPGFLKAQTSVVEHFVGDRLHVAHDGSAEDIRPGSGAVVRVEGRRCAVYRNDSGAVSAVSARCTHMGCLVGFNDDERVWECPCHGSRFATDGSVVQGPATRPLERRDIPAEGLGPTGDESTGVAGNPGA